MHPTGRATGGHSVFEVHLVKTGELLGIEVLLLEPSDNFLFASGLVVERVSEDGLAGTWNRWSNESSQIRAGDIIFKVNDVEEDSEALFNELQSQMELHISIMRPNCSAWNGKGSTPTIPAPPQQPPPPLYQQQQVALAPPMERPTPAGGSFQQLHMERPQSQATSQQLEQLNQQYQQQVAQLQQMYWQQEQQLHQQWMNHLHQQYISQMQSLQQQWEQDQLHIMNQMPSSFQSVRPSAVLGAEMPASSGRGGSGGFAGGMSAGGGPSGFSARAGLPTAGAGALGAGAPSGVGTGAVGGSAPAAREDPSPAAPGPPPGAHVDLTYAVRNSTLASYMKHSFTAFVKRESLGLGVTVRAGTLGDVASFLVSQIRPGGALSVWNASCPPSSVIHEGDAVIGINGISLDLNNMAEEVRVCQEMRLTVLPRTAWPGLGILDDHTSSTGGAPNAGGAPLAPNAGGAPLAPHAEDLPFPGTLHGTPGTPGSFIVEGRPLAAAAASRH